MVSLVIIGLSSWSVPMAAQSGFATNTPSGDAAVPAATTVPDTGGDTSSGGSFFATNTPSVAIVAPAPETATNNTTTNETVSIPAPTAPLANYSLRIWLEADLLALVSQLIGQLDADNADSQLALRLTLHELSQRFPTAPTDLGVRQQIIEAMIAAPRGTVDMRSFVRPFIEASLNNDPTTTSVLGFQLTLTPAQIDNRNNDVGNDAVVNIRYTDPTRGILYDDYLIAVRTATGGYTFLNTTYGLTAAPFGGVETVVLRRVEDVNADGLDEMVLRVDDEQVNDRLLIVGFRNEEAQNLVEPLQDIRLGRIFSWPVEDTTQLANLTVQNLIVDSEVPNWPCLSQREMVWTYELNLYRLSSTSTDTQRIESLGCTLFDAEPLFALSVDDAIDTVERAILTYTLDAPGSQRSLMYLAMLYVISGRLNDARNVATQINTSARQGSWAQLQANAMLQALDSTEGTSSLEVCASLTQASTAPACDTNAVLGRFLARLDLRTNTDLVLQLEGAGLPISEVVTLSEVGRADRPAVSFNVTGTTFWAFAPQDDGTYLPEVVEDAESFATTDQPFGFLEAPDAALTALFFDNDPLRTLDLIDNLQQNNPDQVLSPSTQYLRALALDLIGNRDAAREEYYANWTRFAGTTFANLSAQHVTLRQ